MVAKPKIPTLSDDPSKQEEIKFLSVLHEATRGNAYVSELFSLPMISWAQKNIADDRPINLFGEYEYRMEQAAANAGSCTRLSATNATLAMEIQALKEACKQYGAENQKQNDAMQLFEAEVRVWKISAEKLANENAEIREHVERLKEERKILTDLVWKFTSKKQEDRDSAMQFFHDARAVGGFV